MEWMINTDNNKKAEQAYVLEPLSGSSAEIDPGSAGVLYTGGVVALGGEGGTDTGGVKKGRSSGFTAISRTKVHIFFGSSITEKELRYDRYPYSIEEKVFSLQFSKLSWTILRIDPLPKNPQHL